jgi:hypothetical protein
VPVQCLQTTGGVTPRIPLLFRFGKCARGARDDRKVGLVEVQAGDVRVEQGSGRVGPRSPRPQGGPERVGTMVGRVASCLVAI